MKVKILASSSSGNCGLVEIGGLKLLLDVGLSFKKLQGLLAQEGVSAAEISGVLITHEHSDHVLAAAGFAALGVPLYATRGTAAGAEVVLKKSLKWNIIPQDGVFKIGAVSVSVFGVPHDAQEPVGYALSFEAERLVWALDMGHLPSGVQAILKSATTLVMESNYCPKLLEADTKRPFSLKQRIKGRHGHLSNETTYEFLTQTRSPSWQQIYLVHLSKECNNPELLQSRYEACGLPVEVVNPAGVMALA